MTQKSTLITETQRLYETGTDEPDKPRFKLKTENGWQTITWGEFLDASTKIAFYFSEIGVGLNTKVAIFAKNQLEWAYFDIALHAVRSVFVPVYTSNTPEQVKYILNHSDAEVIVTELERLPVLFKIWKELHLIKKVVIIDLDNEHQLLSALERFTQDTGITLKLEYNHIQVISLTAVYQCGEVLKNENTQGLKAFIDKIHPDDVSTILYTSGTTGEPKGVVLTRDNLYTNAEDWIQILANLIPETRIDLLWLPMSHIFGWGELGLGNRLDFTTYLSTHTAVLNDMPTVKPTIFMSVPAYWEKLYLELTLDSKSLQSH